METEFNINPIYENVIRAAEKNNIIWGLNEYRLEFFVSDKIPKYFDRFLEFIKTPEFIDYFEYKNNRMTINCSLEPDNLSKIRNSLPSTANTKKYIVWENIDPDTIDSHTRKVESPVAEVSRILTEKFVISSSFGTVNTEAIANLIGRKLSTDKIHKAILDNFNGVRFRRQSRGFTYTLRRRDTSNFND